MTQRTKQARLIWSKNTYGISMVTGVVMLYQYTLKMLLLDTCLFHPTCSVYMIEAVRRHGMVGLWMGLKRLARCHPWGRVRCFDDPVPPASPSSFYKKDTLNG